MESSQLTSLSCHLESKSDSGVRKSTYPDKAGGEPGLSVGPPSPPPVCVGSVKHMDNVPSFESQLLLLHGHMVPEGLGIHGVPGVDPLRHRQAEGRQAQSRDHSWQVPCYVKHLDVVELGHIYSNRTAVASV